MILYLLQRVVEKPVLLSSTYITSISRRNSYIRWYKDGLYTSSCRNFCDTCIIQQKCHLRWPRNAWAGSSICVLEKPLKKVFLKSFSSPFPPRVCIFGYTKRCFCGDKDSKHDETPLDRSSCQMPCSGDHDQYCGGKNAINVYGPPRHH